MKHGANIYKYAENLACNPDEILDFSSNINSYHPEINIKISNEILVRYGDSSNKELKKSIADKYKIKKNQIVLYNGATSAIYELFKHLESKKIYLYAPLYGEYEKAVEEYEKALDLDPDMGSTLNELGFVYLRLGEYEKAVSSLKKYVSVTPGEPNAVESLAQVYVERGDLDMAIAKYRELLELDPDLLTSIRMLHCFKAVKEDYAEAHKWIDRHISLR